MLGEHMIEQSWYTSTSITEFIAALPTWFLILALLYVAVLLTIAVLKGQEVQFIPPKIGPRPQTPPDKEKNGIRTIPVAPSKRTPDPEFLTPIINSAIETVCRAVSLPDTPDRAALRVFIFHRQKDQLVCTHFWAQNPVVEAVRITQFDLTDEAEKDVAVVRAFRSKSTYRTPISPNPRGAYGKIDQKIRYVLATPIFNKDKSVWGCVDFDASNEIGVTLLSSKISDSVMLHLARHLSIIFESHGRLSQESA